MEGSKANKIYLDDTFTSYTFKEIPGAVITDICDERLPTGMHMELFEVVYEGLTAFVVMTDTNGKGSTTQYKSRKTAQSKYDKIYASEMVKVANIFEEAESAAEEWEAFRKEAVSDYKKWKKVV